MNVAMKIDLQNMLIISDDSYDESAFRQALLGCSDVAINLFFAPNIFTAKKILSRNNIELVVLNILQQNQCIETLKEITEGFANYPIIVLVNKEDNHLAYIKEGADEVIDIDINY